MVIIPCLEQGDLFSALKFQDTYFHILILPSYRQFLQFTLGQDQYQYRELPFGLLLAPRVFSKVLSIVAAHLRTQGIMIYPVLDNCLLRRSPTGHPWNYGRTHEIGHTSEHPKIDSNSRTMVGIYRGRSRLTGNESAPSTAQISQLVGT